MEGNAPTDQDRARTATPSVTFDELEMLGPSLLQVLTLVRPPVPRSQQGQQDPQVEAAPDENADESTTSEGGNGSETEATDTVDAKFDTCITRSAVLGKLVDPTAENARKIQEHLAALIPTLERDATGVILLLEATVVMWLETTSADFITICRGLQQQRIVELTSMKVLASCDDNCTRVLQGLYFRKISLTKAAADAGEWTEDGLRQLAVDTFLNLVKFAKRLGSLQPADIRKALTTLSNTDQMLLPSNELVLWFLQRDDVMPLQEFLEIFDTPIVVELESERVWPAYPILRY